MIKCKKMEKLLIVNISLLASLVLTLISCSTVPRQTQEEWAEQSNIAILNPEEFGVDLNAINQLLDDIETGRWINVHGLMIIKEGNLIAEGYWNGSHVAKLHDIRSASKSIASILIGIAIDQGHINSVQDRVYDYLPEFEPSFPNALLNEYRDQWKNELSIEHLLNMTSGYEFDDWFENFRGEWEIHLNWNWTKFAATSEIVRRPGTGYAYNTASLVLLSEIISRSSGMPTLEFAEQFLFNPLGISNWNWPSRWGVVYMGGFLRITLRDMARIGLLMVNDGVWNDERIISSRWIDEIEIEPSDYDLSWQRLQLHHHYLWWPYDQEINERRVISYSAQGNGGQVIYIVPEHNIVIAMTTGNYNSPLEPQSIQIIHEEILPALIQNIEY